ncbi:uncharacterized protein LOC134531265 [Bacillus rossius redtenbacheri]|uniref:uncharacterized protein LOC134531265 n=1 Tax=Bacillus rossius redtenbacheri TaxID=93214 RepID=UPI002FDDC897
MKKDALYAVGRDLGGASVWALDADDWAGRCFNIEYPLLTNILRVIHYDRYLDFALIKRLAASMVWTSAPSHEDLITTMQTALLQRHHKRGVFLDFTCARGQMVLQEGCRQELLGAGLLWLVLAEGDIERVPELNLSVDSEVTWALGGRLYDLHGLDGSRPAVVTPAGRWGPSSGVQCRLAGCEHGWRRDLQGLVLRAGILMNHIPDGDLASQLTLPEFREKEPLATFSYAIFQFLMQQFNFTVELLPTSAHGYVVDSGRLEGLVRMMAEGRVDLHVTALQINRARLRHMDFTGHTWKFSIFRHPPVTGGPRFLLLPFAGDLWLALAGTCALAAGTVQLASRARACPLRMGLGDTLLMVVGCVGLQGFPGDGRLASWRIAFLSLLLLTLLSYASYSASIVSALLSEVPRSVDTPGRLLDSQLQFGVEDSPYKLYFQSGEADAVARRLHARNAPGPDLPLAAGVQKVLREQFAFHAEDWRLYGAVRASFPEQKKCSLAEVQLFPPQPCYVAVRKRSPFKELVTRGVAEAGLLDHHSRVWRPPRPTCLSSSEVATVGLQGLTPAFALLLSGALLSLGLLLLEAARCNR